MFIKGPKVHPMIATETHAGTVIAENLAQSTRELIPTSAVPVERCGAESPQNPNL
jgi:hypothetical protein